MDELLNLQNTPGHCRTRLEQILNPVIDGGCAANLTRWENQVNEYESLTTQKIGEEMKSAIFNEAVTSADALLKT